MKIVQTLPILFIVLLSIVYAIQSQQIGLLYIDNVVGQLDESQSHSWDSDDGTQYVKIEDENGNDLWLSSDYTFDDLSENYTYSCGQTFQVDMTSTQCLTVYLKNNGTLHDGTTTSVTIDCTSLENGNNGDYYNTDSDQAELFVHYSYQIEDLSNNLPQAQNCQNWLGLSQLAMNDLQSVSSDTSATYISINLNILNNTLVNIANQCTDLGGLVNIGEACVSLLGSLKGFIEGQLEDYVADMVSQAIPGVDIVDAFATGYQLYKAYNEITGAINCVNTIVNNLQSPSELTAFQQVYDQFLSKRF